MGQKVSPISFRTGVTIGWKSRWYARKSYFGEFLVEDERIRRFIDQRLNRRPPYAAVSSVEIERTREEVKVMLRTARPGLVIGPKGAEVDKLRAALEDLTNRRVSINILEVKRPDLDAKLVADGIAEQLKRRASFRRTIKQRAEATMQAGAKGVKIIISGRLGGADMGRTEAIILGSIPLHTLEADVDYGFAPSMTTYGTIGVKVWIYRGMFGEALAEEEDGEAQAAMTRARRRREHRDTPSGDARGRGAPAGRSGGPGAGRRAARPAPTASAGQVAAPAQPAAPPAPPAPAQDQGASPSADAPADQGGQ
ncbi:MAG TPA: 30S ribosomal protein S3 [Phycisphaerae bacterium]|nr:30S ribosomal protein S3 [Phycisphaerae bacterium]